MPETVVAPRRTQRIKDQIAKDYSEAGGMVGPIVRWLRDFLSNPDDLQSPVTAEDYEGFAICLEGTLGGTTASDNDTFDVPPTHNFLVTEIRGHFGWSVALTGETAIAFGGSVLAGAANSDAVLSAIIQKAANTQIALKMETGNRKIFDGNGSMTLADIYSVAGGKALEYKPAPLILPAGSKIRMDLTAAVATAAQQGSAFNAGIVLIGALVRCG